MLEFKVHDPEYEDILENAVREALRQIKDKKYDSELAALGSPGEGIRHYGVAFEGKKFLLDEKLVK